MDPEYHEGRNNQGNCLGIKKSSCYGLWKQKLCTAVGNIKILSRGRVNAQEFLHLTTWKPGSCKYNTSCQTSVNSQLVSPNAGLPIFNYLMFNLKYLFLQYKCLVSTINTWQKLFCVYLIICSTVTQHQTYILHKIYSGCILKRVEFLFDNGQVHGILDDFVVIWRLEFKEFDK